MIRVPFDFGGCQLTTFCHLSSRFALSVGCHGGIEPSRSAPVSREFHIFGPISRIRPTSCYLASGEPLTASQAPFSEAARRPARGGGRAHFLDRSLCSSTNLANLIQNIHLFKSWKQEAAFCIYPRRKIMSRLSNKMKSRRVWFSSGLARCWSLP